MSSSTVQTGSRGLEDEPNSQVLLPHSTRICLGLCCLPEGGGRRHDVQQPLTSSSTIPPQARHSWRLNQRSVLPWQTGQIVSCFGVESLLPRICSTASATRFGVAPE